MADAEAPEADLLGAVRGLIGSRDRDLAAAAVEALGAFGPVAAAAVPELVLALWYGEPEIRPAAAETLGRLRADPDTTVPALGRVLADRDAAVARAAVAALAQFGPAAAPCLPQLVATIAAAVVEGQHEQVNATLWAMSAVTPDVRAAVREYLTDPEHQRQARIALKELGLS